MNLYRTGGNISGAARAELDASLERRGWRPVDGPPYGAVETWTPGPGAYFVTVAVVGTGESLQISTWAAAERDRLASDLTAEGWSVSPVGDSSLEVVS